MGDVVRSNTGDGVFTGHVAGPVQPLPEHQPFLPLGVREKLGVKRAW